MAAGIHNRRPPGIRTKHRVPGGITPGVIRDDETLTIDAFCERMGMTRSYVFRNLREVVRGSSYHAVVPGRVYNEWIAQQPMAELKKCSPRRRDGTGKIVPTLDDTHADESHADGSTDAAQTQEHAEEAASV